MESSKQMNKETVDKEQLTVSPEKEPAMTKEPDKKHEEDFKRRYCI